MASVGWRLSLLQPSDPFDSLGNDPCWFLGSSLASLERLEQRKKLLFLYLNDTKSTKLPIKTKRHRNGRLISQEMVTIVGGLAHSLAAII